MKTIIALCLTFALVLSLVACSMKQVTTAQENERQQGLEKAHAELNKFLSEEPKDEPRKIVLSSLQAITMKDVQEVAKAHPNNKFYYASGKSMDIHSLPELTREYQIYTIDGEKVEVRLELAEGRGVSSTYRTTGDFGFLEDFRIDYYAHTRLPTPIKEKLGKEVLQDHEIQLGEELQLVLGFQLMNHARQSIDKLKDFSIRFYPFYYSIRYQGATYNVLKKYGRSYVDGIIEMRLEDVKPEEQVNVDEK